MCKKWTNINGYAIIIKKYKKNEDGSITEVIIDQTKLIFKNYSNLLKPLTVIYVDFEAINKKINKNKNLKSYWKRMKN